MAKTDKAGIYVDGYALFEVLLRVLYKMTRADKINIGSAMIGHCEKFIANFVLAYEVHNKREEYIEQMIAEFEMLKLNIRTAKNIGAIKDDKNESMAKETVLLLSRIDDGIMKWKTSTLRSVGETSK